MNLILQKVNLSPHITVIEIIQMTVGGLQHTIGNIPHLIGNTILIGQKLKGLIFSLMPNKAQNNIVSLLYVPLR